VINGEGLFDAAPDLWGTACHVSSGECMKIEGRPEREEEPKWRRRLRRLGWGVVILVVVTAIANLRMAPSIEGWAIDARSGEPLADVVVVAYWGMERAWAWSVAPAGALAVFEVVTGEDGHYRVPGWGPRWATYGIRESSDPLIILFKSGYEPVILDNMTATGRGYNRPGAMYLPSMWDGKTVEMVRFDGDLRKHADVLGVVGQSLQSYVVESNCGWKRIPQILLAMRHERKIFEGAGILASFIHAGHIHTDEFVCGSPDAFFREYER
jgi:hypothetical protein